MIIWLTLGCLLLPTLYILKRYFAGGVCRCPNSLNGKLVIITGANSGIGKATAGILAEKGASIILACRNEVEGLRVADELRISTGNPLIRYEYLDLTSFEGIVSFVTRLKRTGCTEIYSLINNAGIFYHPFLTTENGFEVTFQTNYLGLFCLTLHLYYDGLFKSNSRIINVLSEAHRFSTELDIGQVFLPNLDLSQFMRYGESKLCVHLFTEIFSTIHKDLFVASVNPGNVETNIFRHYPLLSNKFLFGLQKPLRWLLVKTPSQGAQSIVHLALSQTCTVHSGKYFSDCKVKEPSKLAQDQDLAKKLWDLSLSIYLKEFKPAENVLQTAE